MQTLNISGILTGYRMPLIPLIEMSLPSLIVFMVTDLFYERRTRVVSFGGLSLLNFPELKIFILY
ncbi:MAG: hypothetical protein LUO93_04885 [Methanomicrobiales archaeon]|nr:hypothetical protein [Methanomicrobiales archaeon]